MVRSQAALRSLPILIALGASSLASLPRASAAPTEGISQIVTLYERGERKFETADYEGAIELWSEAYALLAPTPENAEIRAKLIYNLAKVHARAFEIEGDNSHLKVSLDLLRNFRASLDADEDADEIAKVAVEIAGLEARIAKLAPSQDSSATSIAPPAPVEAPPPTSGPLEADEPADASVDAPAKPGTPSIATGGVLLALGAIGGGVAITGAVMAANANDISDIDVSNLDERRRRLEHGQTANYMALSGSISAGVLVPAGVALLVIGVVRNNKANKRHVTFAPSFGSRAAEVVISGRF